MRSGKEIYLVVGYTYNELSYTYRLEDLYTDNGAFICIKITTYVVTVAKN